MLNDTINWLPFHKDTFSSLQSLATIIALIIGGFWALRKIYYERPYEGALEISINGSLISSITSANLIHLFIRVKNIGKAAIKIGNTDDSSYNSSIKVYAFSKSTEFLRGDNNSTSSTINTSLVNSESSDLLINGDFAELFKPWFEDRKFAILESGESETYSLDFALDKSISVILVQITIYETRKNRALGRPYYWRDNALINCTAST